MRTHSDVIIVCFQEHNLHGKAHKPGRGSARLWSENYVTTQRLVGADQSERSCMMRGAALCSSSPRGVLWNPREKQGWDLKKKVALLHTLLHKHLLPCNCIFPHHQECATPAILAYNSSEWCGRETWSSRCHSTHLNDLSRYAMQNVWWCQSTVSNMQRKCLFEGYRIHIVQQVCWSLFSSNRRWPPELEISPSHTLRWTSSPEAHDRITSNRHSIWQ